MIRQRRAIDDADDIVRAVARLMCRTREMTSEVKREMLRGRSYRLRKLEARACAML